MARVKFWENNEYEKREYLIKYLKSHHYSNGITMAQVNHLIELSEMLDNTDFIAYFDKFDPKFKNKFKAAYRKHSTKYTVYKNQKIFDKTMRVSINTEDHIASIIRVYLISHPESEGKGKIELIDKALSWAAEELIFREEIKNHS